MNETYSTAERLKVLEITRVILMIFCFSTSSSAYAEESKNRGLGIHLPTFSFFKDSDDFQSRRIGIGVYPLYEGFDSYTGLNVQKFDYSRNAWSADAIQLSAVHRKLDRDGFGRSIALGIHSLDSKDLVVIDSNFGFPIADGLRSEIFLVRDRVETQQALTNNIYFDFFGASFEKRFTARLVAVGLIAQQRFSDDNTRDHQRVRLIYDLYPDSGINIQFRYRQYQNSSSFSPNYFSPDRYAEEFLALGFRRRSGDWSVAGLAGSGRQRVSDDPFVSTYLYELDVRKRLAANDWLRVRLLQGKSEGFGSPSYTYQLIELGLLLELKGTGQ